ncbi:hypothetical protein GOP47_0009664 [Adiantum capillus-veneris]|uniref:Reticulon-like protein n=1 Tax=Adiantum capillus-veneris TaxID=13818 RepID=A0A9D4UXW8_ADICA|nr:hypothetical protein GOP47_0009664 [Adiantum capillus-veneris]
MGSGREGGSPSPAMASVPPRQVITSSSMLTHKMHREELLEGGSNAAADVPGGKANPSSSSRNRTPRAGNTPLHSPRSMSPLRGLSSTEVVSSEIASASLIDFQEAILRASNAQKAIPKADNYSLPEEPMDFQKQKTLKRTEELPSEALAVVTRSKSEVAHTQGGQQQLRSKSPFPPSKQRSSAEDMNHEVAVPTRSTKRIEAANASSSEWVLLDRGKSPRRSKVSSSTVMEAQDLQAERKSSRSSSRKSKIEVMEELPDPDLGMGDANRATRRAHARAHTRQHKRKASESVTVIAGAASPPDSYVAQRSPTLHQRQQLVAEYQVPPYRVERHTPVTSSPASSSSRRASREARIVATSGWLQFLGDIIMWRHIPRSALLFGLGCFCIMSASLIQDMQYSTFSVMAYMALFYLAARFMRCNFLRGSPSTLSVGLVTEADALRLIRVVLPPFNLMLQKLGDLFSGEPIVTLKVAGALWFLARAASTMNIWTLARVAYFALFTVPKCYTSYHDQIETQVRNVLHWVRSTWGACGHKKAVLFAGFLVVWNFSSVSTRICGAFLTLTFEDRSLRFLVQ